MISKLWWVNFLLALFTLLLIAGTVMIWQQAIVVPSPDVSAQQDQWPDPVPDQRIISATEDYNAIAENNLFHGKRMEHTPKAVEPVKLPEPVAVKTVEPEPAPKEVTVLEKKDLNVFGVIIMDTLKYAFVNDLGGENDKKQIRVGEKDPVGPYVIESISSDHVIVSFQGNHYKVPVFDKKDPDVSAPPEKQTVTPAKSSAPASSPVVISTDKRSSQPDIKTAPDIKNDQNDEDEWIILDTPFGKKRIKRKK